jgi:hypothetical protein
MTPLTTSTPVDTLSDGFAIIDERILDDIQGNILAGYRAKFVRHLIVRVNDIRAARDFLAAAVTGRDGVPQVTTAQHWAPDVKPTTCLNVGISSTGLRALGLDDRALQTFPVEFVQGVTVRGAKIGDVEDSAPSRWRHGLGDADAVHLMWSIHGLADPAVPDGVARARVDVEELAAALESMWAESGAFTVTSCIDGATFDTYPGHAGDDGSKVHFGYRDSLSQPRFAVAGQTYGARDDQPVQPVGAVLLGSEYATPFHDVKWQRPMGYRGTEEFDLGRNGCFNAFRVLDQRVREFEQFLEESAAKINAELDARRADGRLEPDAGGEASIVWDAERVAAKLMGRWRNGVPLSPSPNTMVGATPGPYLGPGVPSPPPDADLNAFEYLDVDPRFDDSDGAQCPLGSHVRRGNPRDGRIVQRSASYTRPIVRRGMPYGAPYDPSAPEDNGVRRGLIGNFLCANLVSQFEAIMYDWINLGLHDPRLTGTNDPIIGANHPARSRFEIPIAAGDGRVIDTIVLDRFGSFTTTAGSVYLFCPSISALRFLAGTPLAAIPSPVIARPSTRVSAGAATVATVATAVTSKRSSATVSDGARSPGWRMRRNVWNKIAVLKYHGQKPAVIPPPAPDVPPIDLVPFVTRHPDISIDGLVVAAELPRDEVDKPKQVFTKFQHHLVRWYSPMQRRLPQVHDDAQRALDAAYTPAHRACFPQPVPTPSDLGALAVASPYASYLTAGDDGTYRWNLEYLTNYEVHRGLLPLGAVVDFRVDASTGQLAPVRIETALGVAHAGGAGWTDATRAAMCAVTSHASMIRHFNWLHLTAGPVLEASTRNHLPSTHPLRRFIWPHVFGTHAGNELVTEILMSKGGEFDAIFSLSHRGKCDLFEATTGAFDLASINPVIDAQRRGVTGLAAPAIEHWSTLYAICRAHADRYLAAYYSSDDDVMNDQHLVAWVEDLHDRLPNGVHGVMGPTVTIDGVAQLLATIVYLATVEHEITGSGLWDYQLWNDTSPVRIREDGKRVPVDVYQRLVNSNFNLNVHRTMLLDDHMPTLALDARGVSSFVQFQQDLLGLQADLDRSRAEPWRIEPRHLKANINA